MNKSLLNIVILLGLGIFTAGCALNKSKSAKMQLVWSDEFNYSGLPDTTKWGYDIGDGCPNVCGWGNNELQLYSGHRLENARVKDGHLIIEARKETKGKFAYTSARMVTKRKGDWKYGKIDVRAKLPKGRGIWPAIWMLPSDWAYGGWPASGEIDIMEHVGYLPDSLYGSVHTKLFNHIQGTQVTGGIMSKTTSTDFHNYGIEWDAEKIDFYYDDYKYLTFNNKHQGSEAWPFDRTFHLILNIAVGGNWGGKMGVDNTIFPQEMQVDYVRIYQ
jgi:beta-glucanase (GH16 family)